MKNKTKKYFIIGCARSGTSILGELIQSHPDVKYIFEASSIWETAGAGINESHRLTADHATPTVAQNICDWFEEQSPNKPVLVEKSPRNSLRIPFVHSIFPNAGFIHIIRDGRDVACSMIPGCGGTEWNHLKPPSWKNLFKNYTGAIRCAHAWKETLEITMAELVQVPHLQIHYEDLIATPYHTAKEIFEFMGLEIHSQTLEFCKSISNQTDAPYHAQYQSQWYRDNHKTRLGRWHENLTRHEQESIQKILAPLIEQLGYSVNDTVETLQKSDKKKLIVVLGMHRSGTSLLTRSLKVMNVYLGDNLMPAVKGVNDKGFWEDMDVFHLNEQILSILSNSWHYLLPISSDDVEKLNQHFFNRRYEFW